MRMRLAVSWALLGTGFTFLMTVLGACVVFLLKPTAPSAYQDATLGFAGGIMTAASIWSLILPSLSQDSVILAVSGILLGGAFVCGLDFVLSKRTACTNGAVLMTAITLHNIPEGMAVGLACAIAAKSHSPAAAFTLAFGIGIQNLPEGAAISLPLFQSGKSRSSSFLYGAASGAVEPIFGVLVVFLVSSVLPLMPFLMCFAAGAMLYVCVADLIPSAKGTLGSFSFLFGFLLMMILDVVFG